MLWDSCLGYVGEWYNDLLPFISENLVDRHMPTDESVDH
jgi:hypothetical protein